MSGLFRSLRPLENPIGFGAADFIILAWAALLALLWLAAARLEPGMRRLAQRTRWSMALLFALPIILRLAMLGIAPVPEPRTPDDFAFLLSADTLAHFRLANPVHPMHQFFETNFVLQEPTYCSIYPLGQGILLAAGQLLFRQPWAGVLLGGGLFCALCYWMLLGWTTPEWALAGGLIAATQYGPMQYWVNTYWGGYLTAAAGCLIFGALPRLHVRVARRDAILLGVGLGIGWLTRPFETVILSACVGLFLLLRWRAMIRITAIAFLAALPAIGLSLLQNRAVTGNWLTLPYILSQHQYGIPTSFTFQPVPTPHRALTQEQKVDYDLQSAVHGTAPDSVAALFRRLGGRVRFYRWFFPVPLLLVLPAFLPALRQPRFLWLAAALAIVVVGTNFYPYFYPHYIAGATCLFVLLMVTALERASRWRRDAVRLLVLLCGVHFLFWYGLQLLSAWPPALALTNQYESWDYVNHRDDPEGRVAIDRQLAAAPGKQLVFVRYAPEHRLRQWVWNAADIDKSRIVRALDLGAGENEKLKRYYPARTVWLLEPDINPPRLTPYRELTAPLQFEGVPDLPLSPR
ncbi:MAG TPA: hypothetical protein VMT86_03020 [Bryobacteraceae bacterium]|nr:hypothetical protein [Bryobacteraceae bacterium]